MITSEREIESSMYGFHYGDLPYHAFCSPEGKLEPVSFTHHEGYAQAIISSNPKWKEEFEQAQKNRGYDAKEFLIINKGYIIISSGHFNFSTWGTTTAKQIKALGCDPRREKHKMDAFFSD